MKRARIGKLVDPRNRLSNVRGIDSGFYGHGNAGREQDDDEKVKSHVRWPLETGEQVRISRVRLTGGTGQRTQKSKPRSLTYIPLRRASRCRPK